jgi:hypothetical protein
MLRAKKRNELMDAAKIEVVTKLRWGDGRRTGSISDLGECVPWPHFIIRSGAAQA